MGDINKYFSRWEIQCSCCDMCAIDPKLMTILVKVREKFGAVFIKKSADDQQNHCICRCLKRNREVFSKDTSYHLKGMAADFEIKEVDNKKIALWIDENYLKATGGIIVYKNFIHCDTRQKIYRADKTK